MQFSRSIWKILHLTEYFYTGTARGARNNYQVCTIPCNTMKYHAIPYLGRLKPQLGQKGFILDVCGDHE